MNKFHRNIFLNLLLALERVFINKSRASKVLLNIVHINSKWGKRDREVLYDAFYSIIRWKKKYEYYLMQSIGKSTNEIALKLSNLNKEHLLPQKPDKWGLTSKNVESYVNSLGNIFLIDIDLNTEMSNDTLDKKIKSLKKSSLLSIKEVYHNKEDIKWGKKEIEKRLDKITNAAWDSIWNID